jgi:pimeloyl-ACP methyl ester carboxylesterase
MRRFFTGGFSALTILGVPLGSWWCRGIEDLQTPDRYERGLVLILPGIEGRSGLNLGIARGLQDGQVPFAIEVADWTSGWLLGALYHLRSRNLHRRAAAAIANRVREYRQQNPDCPTFLIGHSGGAGVLLRALETLPADCRVSSAILLAAAVSPDYDLSLAASRVERKIWNFHSIFDVFQLGIGTLLFGTLDGPHRIAAGNRGFLLNESCHVDGAIIAQVPYAFRMASSWNLGGHQGATNRLFARDWLAPKLLDPS